MLVRLTVGELFCGAGGTSLGFRDAGYAVRWGVDIESDMVGTFSLNFPEALVIKRDIRLVGSSELEPVDVVLAGFPCQGFTTMGKRMIDDPRNSLYRDFVRIVGEIRPKWVVGENVEGLLSMRTVDGDSVVDEIVGDFSGIGYSLRHRVLDAASYGVPQHRRRLIFVGNRVGSPVAYPAHTHGESATLTLGDRAATIPYRTVRWALGGMPNTTPENRDKYGGVASKKGYYPFFRQDYRRLAADSPSPTVTTGCEFLHPWFDRPLTIRECARLQSFPDSFKIRGSERSQSVMVGNAVPPLLASAVAKSIMGAPGWIL